MKRQDDITAIEKALRLPSGRHSPYCATAMRHEGGATIVPVWAYCDCGRDALDRLRYEGYEEMEDDHARSN